MFYHLNPHSKRRKTYRIIVLLEILMIVFGLLAYVASAAQLNFIKQPAQSVTDAHALEPFKPILREDIDNRVHHYDIDLAANQYVLVSVNQRGVDVAMSLRRPDGQAILSLDSYKTISGTERACWIADQSTRYRLEIHTLKKDKSSASYVIEITELRSATDTDRIRIAAQKAFIEGEQFYSQMPREGVDKKAIEKYSEALRLWNEVGEKSSQAIALDRLGTVYNDTGNRQKAIESYDHSLAAARDAADRTGEAAALQNLGAVYDDLGQKQKAIEYYSQSIDLVRPLRNRLAEASALHNMGLVYDDLGQKTKSLDHYERALLLVRAVGDQRGEAATLTAIGSIYNELDEREKALSYFEQALKLRREVNDRRGEVITLNHIGLLYRSMGELQKAMSYLDQSLPIVRAIGDKRREASAVNNIALIYGTLGDLETSLEYHEHALQLVRSAGGLGSESAILINIGTIYDKLDQPEKALNYFAQALELVRKVKDITGEVAALNRTGLVYEYLKDHRKSLEYFNQALPLVRSTRNRSGEGATLGNIGRAYTLLGDTEKAADYLNKALQLKQAVSDLSGQASTHNDLANLHRKRGDLTSARHHIESAINITESLRARIAAMELRASYLASRRSYYDLYVDILMSMHQKSPSTGYDRTALHVSERARAQGLIDLLSEAGTDTRKGASSALLDRERSLRLSINAKAGRRMRLLSAGANEDEAISLEKNIEELLTEYRKVEAEIRSSNQTIAGLITPEPLGVEEIQRQLLDENTLLLEYMLGDDKSHLWVVSQTDVISYELPGRAIIEDASRMVYNLVTARSRSYQNSAEKQSAVAKADGQYIKASADLSRILLGQTGGLLQKKRLLIVADGALHYVPFAGLPSPVKYETERKKGKKVVSLSTQPLVVNNEIISLPSATALSVLRRETSGRQSAPRAVAVIADPVFDQDDVRIVTSTSGSSKASSSESGTNAGTRRIKHDLKKATKDFGLPEEEFRIERLPGTRREAEYILNMVAQSEGKKALDFDASLNTAINSDLSQYRIVHFATHGLINSVHPELSGIVLSLFDKEGNEQEGFLRSLDIFKLNLPADLVVLSACQTGLGKEVRSEGMIGLTQAFMYAGTRRVTVSLWGVSDRATPELMKIFYEGMLVRGLSPAAALRAAQVEMWKRRNSRAPYYWAAFTIHGEWK